MDIPQSPQYREPNLEGEMSVPGFTTGSSETKEYHTLDEPVKDTILRDLTAVGFKFYHVLYPKQKKALLKDWDLWGPLILCVFLALVLQGSETSNDFNDGGLQFAEIFIIVWLGAVVVTLNSKLIGGNISFFQSVCVLGYCLLAPSLALVLNLIVPLIFNQTLVIFIIKFIFSMLGFAWATLAATVFLGDSQPLRRKALAVYPIFLFYFIICWLIISRSTEIVSLSLQPHQQPLTTPRPLVQSREAGPEIRGERRNGTEGSSLLSSPDPIDTTTD